MADVSLTPNANSKELYGQGIRAYVLQDYDTAVRAFSTTSELLSQEHGNELHDSLGDVYLYYGKSLLELSRKEGGPLGEGVLKNVEEESEEELEEVEGEEENKEDSKTEENKEDSETEDANKTDDAKTEEANLAGDAKTDEEKESEKKDESTEGEANGSGEKKEGETEDELTDLQVAWEVLELAKRIFANRGDDAKKNLAETLITLGEVSLESGNFASAIEDMAEGLKIQKELFGNDSRAIAETCYKLGGAYSTNGQIEEAIESFNTSNEYLQNKVTSLQKDEEHKEANAEEIEELNSLIPEIQEKIADMKNLKSEIANKMTAQVEETVAAPKTNGTSEASSSKQVNDISHLVKRKRKDEGTQEEQPAKRPSP